jgi:hypothetical protein
VHPRARVLIAASLAALALALGACDGGDGDEDRITEAIERSATTTVPADCNGLATQDFLEQTQFDRGAAALQSCREDARNTTDDPESVEVSGVGVDGDRALRRRGLEALSDRRLEVFLLGGDAALLVELLRDCAR